MKKSYLSEATKRYFASTITTPGKQPRPPNVTPQGRARKARREKIEDIEERRELERELADW